MMDLARRRRGGEWLIAFAGGRNGAFARGAIILGRVDIRLKRTIAALSIQISPAILDFYPVIPAKSGIQKAVNVVGTTESA